MIEIMQSIQPKWCNEIISGKKTIEVRKTRPKIEPPFKVDIYCTNDRKIMLERSNYDKSIYLNGNIYYPHKMDCSLNGKVIGDYICDEITTYSYDKAKCEYDRAYWFPDHRSKSCLSDDDLLTYGDGKTLYGWHISDLKIYDKPLELTDFIHPTNGCVNEGKCRGCKYLDRGIDGIIEDDCTADFDTDSYSILKRAPQDWCYVHRID